MPLEYVGIILWPLGFRKIVLICVLYFLCTGRLLQWCSFIGRRIFDSAPCYVLQDMGTYWTGPVGSRRMAERGLSGKRCLGTSKIAPTGPMAISKQDTCYTKSVFNAPNSAAIDQRSSDGKEMNQIVERPKPGSVYTAPAHTFSCPYCLRTSNKWLYILAHARRVHCNLPMLN